ncbi:xylulokinase [Leifsonia aquatica]|uniref:xylulokinase n=1 Tax=Leifsonia aquatica TaxID=144185 RepID=UPI00046A9B7B|nr:FGGY family carbohydrate kinase [Leifsonia aquatica]
MTDQGDVAIGLDFGTSGAKAVAVTPDGSVIARAAAGYETRRPAPDAAEQDPADWIRARDRVLADLAAQTDPGRWGALALSAMLPTLVELDPAGRPVAPAITWEDGRADPEARRIVAAAGEAVVYRTTGQRLDGRYLLPMHARLARAGAHGDTTVAGAKDYVFASLTARVLTDPSTAAGYGAYALRGGTWNASILAAAGVDAARLPPIAPSGSSAPLLPEAADLWRCRPGIPVVLGAADSVLGAYGLGVRSPGAVAYVAGTSTVILGWSASPDPDPLGRYLVTPMADGGFGLEMDLMATGSALAWLAGLLGIDGGAAGIVALAEEGDLTDSPLVLPYLSPGEQGALWDPGLRGAIDGVTLRTTRGDLARGLLAGIVVESTRCLAALAEVDGAGPVVISGRGGASRAFRQALADASGRMVLHDPGEQDHSALGAALLAGRTALGWPDVAVEAARPSLHDGFVAVRPDPRAADAWADRYDRHERARLAQRARHD